MKVCVLFLFLINSSLLANDSINLIIDTNKFPNAPLSYWDENTKKPKEDFHYKFLMALSREMDKELKIENFTQFKNWLDLRSIINSKGFIDIISYTNDQDFKKNKKYFYIQYHSETLNALVLKESKIKELDDLKKSDVCYFPGLEEADSWAQQHVTGKIINDQFYNFEGKIKEEIVAAGIVNYSIASWFTKNNKNLKIFEKPLQSKDFYIVIPAENKILYEEISSVIKKFKQEGVIEKIYKNHINDIHKLLDSLNKEINNVNFSDFKPSQIIKYFEKVVSSLIPDSKAFNVSLFSKKDHHFHSSYESPSESFLSYFEYSMSKYFCFRIIGNEFIILDKE